MTEQERVAALEMVSLIERGLFGLTDISKKGEGLIADALRAYARPAPADLREAITCLLIETEAESYEDIADEIISLLPQAQDMDDAASFDARVNAAECILRGGEG